MSMRAVAVPAPLRQPARILRLVRPGEITPKARKRRARLAATFTVCLIGVGLFATVAFHVVLTQNQFRLDHLTDRATEEQARYSRLRLQVAELESPSRVVAAAQDKLGMVQPPAVAYLAPQAPTNGSVTTPSDPEADAHGDWSTVKSQLAAHP
jgi:cell division protein FtsL